MLRTVSSLPQKYFLVRAMESAAVTCVNYFLPLAAAASCSVRRSGGGDTFLGNAVTWNGARQAPYPTLKYGARLENTE